MIYGAINEKGKEHYTHLDKVFKALDNEQINYNWLITNCECYPENKETDKLLSQEYCWLTGERLTRIVKEEPLQCVWAVLSGFKKDIPLSEVLKYPLPYADGYKGFWENPISIQNPLASIEIVAFDSSLTLIFSDKKNIVDKFIKGYPSSEDLVIYNNRTKSIKKRI